MPQEFASNRPGSFIGKIMFSVELRNLHVSVHFGAVDNILLLQPIVASFINRFVKVILPME